MFDKFLKKDKITSLDVTCRYNSRKIRENQCFGHIPAKSARAITNFNCLLKSIDIINFFKAIG